MKRIILGNLFLLVCFIACSSQNSGKHFDWKVFNFEDAGIKVSLFCEPAKSVKVFQEKPKLAQRYTFDCKKENFELSISLSEHFGDFDENKAKENIDFIEKMMKENMGTKADFQSKDMRIQGFVAKEFYAKSDSRLAKHIHIQNKRGAYNVQIVSTKSEKQSRESFVKEFDKNSKELFDSIQIVEK